MIPNPAQLELIATGAVVVVAALAFLWLVTAAVGQAFLPRFRNAAAANPPAAAEVPAHHRVAIAAAVAVALQGRPHRILTVQVPALRIPGWGRP